MNSLTALLVVVVVGVVAPVQGRMALGRAQDTGLASGTIPKYSESQTNKAIANMQRLFAMTREVAELVAKQENPLMPVDPKAIQQLELMEKIIPESIKIVASLAADTADNPMLDPALVDFSGSVGAGGSPQPAPVVAAPVMAAQAAYRVPAGAAVQYAVTRPYFYNTGY